MANILKNAAKTSIPMFWNIAGVLVSPKDIAGYL